MIRMKRAYEQPSRQDGVRILVERLWPRGLTKERAAVDLWLKDVAPSPALRKWFSHDPAKWDRFEERYWKELRGHPEAVEQVRRLARNGAVTLVFSARDEEHNAAVALREFIKGHRKESGKPASRTRARAASTGGGAAAPSAGARRARRAGAGGGVRTE